tara:strand:- start:99 stop:2015 length:1917 start_codon:yes stop_codon:yes gene_type:complete
MSQIICGNCKTEIFFTEFAYAIVPICVPRKDRLSKKCDRTLKFIGSLEANVSRYGFTSVTWELRELIKKIEVLYNLFGIKSIDTEHFSRKYELIDLIESFEKVFVLIIEELMKENDDFKDWFKDTMLVLRLQLLLDETQDLLIVSNKLDKFIGHLLDNKDDAFQQEPNKGSPITDLFIFDLDNTLRYEIDDTPIEHGINLLNNVLNKENTSVYIASCNRNQSAVNWVENNNYTDKVSIHAPICGSGFKDLTSVVETFNDLNIDENANKFVIGDTFKDMDSIKRVKDKFSGNGLQNWYFIRSYFKSKKWVDQYLDNNPAAIDFACGIFDSEEKFYNYDCGDLYFLPDAVLLENLPNLGVLLSDHNNFKNIKLFEDSKPLYIKATYGEHYLHEEDIDVIENKFKKEFSVAILGRYFRASEHSYSNPARISSAEILDFKKGITPLSNNLKSSMDIFFKEQIKNFTYKNLQDGSGAGYSFEDNMIITSVPNSDGEYRFKDYLLNLKNTIKDINTELNIFVLDDFIKQTGEKSQNHTIRGVDNKIENVKDKYTVNEKYLGKQEFSWAYVFVIDDVLTSGSTFNEINETLCPHNFHFCGVALGKTQSYPYTDSKGLVSYNYLPLNASTADKSFAWMDFEYIIGH